MNSHRKSRPPEFNHVVVLGAPRSGTTYLMRLLNSLPETECVIGTLMSSSIPQIARQELPDDIYDALAVSFERAIDAYMHSGRYMSRAAAMQKWTNAPNGIRGLIRAMKGTRNATTIAYKEPFLSFAPDFVDTALPSAKVIHLYRDGRDVANSLVRSYDVLTDASLTDLTSTEMRLGRRVDHRYVPWWVEPGREEEFLNSTPYVRAIWMWKHMVGYCRDYYTRTNTVGSDRVMTLRYEDLMTKPESYGIAVLSHLGAEPSKEYHRVLRSAHSRSIGKYRQRDAGEIRRAEDVARLELMAYGYL